ncbi:MAG: preprotein translocase subunit YajC [Deltaproteobacteria bacterium]|nr:MAG: preprotein translocase subunit YajC [Deltaproteobacteria bacterium]
MLNFVVYAMGANQGAQQAQGGGISIFIPLILMFVIFYFLLIRPQQKKVKQHKEMIASIKKGDKVVTAGGIHGTVTGVSDNTVSLEIAPKVKIKVQKGSISYILGRGSQQQKPEG